MRRGRGGSLSFERAAEYYDRTRTTSPEAQRRVIEMLRSELDGRDPCLDVGVGTGQIALPLHQAGLRMAGLDLSMAMVRRLIEKAGGVRPFPVVLGDATALPFADARFGSAIVRHVFQLIPEWESAVTEIRRAVRTGGVILVNQAGVTEGEQAVLLRLEGAFGGLGTPVGLHWKEIDLLDRAMSERGAPVRSLPEIVARGDLTVGKFLGQIADGLHSWTWSVSDEVRRRAVDEVSRWAAERFGGLDVILDEEYPIRWRAYDVRR